MPWSSLTEGMVIAREDDRSIHLQSLIEEMVQVGQDGGFIHHQGRAGISSRSLDGLGSAVACECDHGDMGGFGIRFQLRNRGGYFFVVWFQVGEHEQRFLPL